MKMNESVKARWVAALRSGQYKQGYSALRSGVNEFCCLGVLCDLYAKDHDLLWKPDGIGMSLPIGGKYYPPDLVRLWSGFHEDGQLVAIDGNTESVAVHNDGASVPRRTFAEIADAIEAQL